MNIIFHITHNNKHKIIENVKLFTFLGNFCLLVHKNEVFKKKVENT